MMLLNIHSKGEYPSNVLSNFYSHHFTFEGYTFECMEGFLQSLKFQSENEKECFSKMDGKSAKLAGEDKKYMSLYWQGRSYDRYSKEYADLLLKAYEAMCLQNTMFQDTLKASYPRILMHTIGKWRRGQTVLTWWEFIRILSKLRSSIIRESRVKSEGEK